MGVHSAKSADTDALFTLLILLTVVILCTPGGERWLWCSSRLWRSPKAG